LELHDDLIVPMKLLKIVTPIVFSKNTLKIQLRSHKNAENYYRFFSVGWKDRADN